MTLATTNLNIEIFLVVRNSGTLLKFFLKHYKENFPGCTITLFDNNSSDDTLRVALRGGCIIHRFAKYTEEDLKAFKNNVWKSSKADWIIIVDVDELIQVTMEDLQALDPDVNALRFEGYQMINKGNTITPYKDLKYGYRLDTYDKLFMFKPSIEEVNYTIGAHEANPKNAVYSSKTFKMFHYKDDWIQPRFPSGVKGCPTMWKLLNQRHSKNLLNSERLIK